MQQDRSLLHIIQKRKRAIETIRRATPTIREPLCNPPAEGRGEIAGDGDDGGVGDAKEVGEGAWVVTTTRTRK